MVQPPRAATGYEVSWQRAATRQGQDQDAQGLGHSGSATESERCGLDEDHWPWWRDQARRQARPAVRYGARHHASQASQASISADGGRNTRQWRRVFA
jgi:hypothetical protein